MTCVRCCVVYNYSIIRCLFGNLILNNLPSEIWKSPYLNGVRVFFFSYTKKKKIKFQTEQKIDNKNLFTNVPESRNILNVGWTLNNVSIKAH